MYINNALNHYFGFITDKYSKRLINYLFIIYYMDFFSFRVIFYIPKLYLTLIHSFIRFSLSKSFIFY